MGLACSSWTQVRHRVFEFVTTTQGQDGVKQASRKNVDGSDAKIRPQVLIDGLSDDLRMTDGVTAVLVYPRVKGGDINVAYFLALTSRAYRATAPVRPPKKVRGVPEIVRDRASEEIDKDKDKVFKEVVQSKENKLHGLLRSLSVTSRSNLRNTRKFRPIFKTNRFRNSFIMFNALKA